MHNHKTIIEKELGIPPDYQFKALRSRLYPQANWHNNKLIVLKKILQPHKEMRILNLGAGSGNLELDLHPLVKEIVALDYNDDAMAFLKKKLKDKNIKNVKVRIKDITELHTLNEQELFDVITMIDVIEHIELEKIHKSIKIMKTLLKKNGRVCIITPNYKGPWSFLEYFLDKISLVPHFDGAQHIAKFDKHNIVNLFAMHDFKVECLKTFNLFSFLFPSKTISGLLVKGETIPDMAYGNLLIAVFSPVKTKK